MIRGGAFSLLCFLCTCTMVQGQSFFSAQILPQSKKYGQVSTSHLSENVITSLRKQNFTFEEWSSFFSLKTTPNGAAVIGEYAFENDQLIFKPRFLPDPAIRYIVSFSYPNLAILLSEIEEKSIYTDIISFKPPETTQPEIISVLPKMDVIPANLLRLYLYFSAPMGLENPYDFVSIEDTDGKKLVDPFVIIPEGLWNIDRTRLTLLLHPGRVKQGVGPNMTLGDVLKAGNSYTLKVDKKWKGSSGEALKINFIQKINASNPLRNAINVNIWALKAKADNIGTLTIVTDRPLDQPLAQRMLFVRNMDGVILPSRVEFENSEKLKILWRADGSKELELVIDPRLEDVCGNTPLYAFDLEEGTRNSISEEIKLKFKVE
ncbi:hypothetical protein [Ekhidna sp.]